MTKTVAATLLVLVLAACGGSENSGIDPGTPVRDLSVAEHQALCEWGVDLQGGPGERDCGDDPDVPVPTVAECVAELAEYTDCSATVGDVESCTRALADDLCTLFHAECAALLPCVL